MCNIYRMASRSIAAIYDLNSEILDQGKAEGQYRGVKVLYCCYRLRRHATYNIFYSLQTQLRLRFLVNMNVNSTLLCMRTMIELILDPMNIIIFISEYYYEYGVYTTSWHFDVAVS